MLKRVLAYVTQSVGNVHSPHEGYSPIGNDGHKMGNNNALEIGGNVPLNRNSPRRTCDTRGTKCGVRHSVPSIPPRRQNACRTVGNNRVEGFGSSAAAEHARNRSGYHSSRSNRS